MSPARRTDPQERVLFLCRHNSARSILAQALLRAAFPGRFDVESAGIEPAGVHPLALEVLREAGVPILGLRSKHVQELAGQRFDWVVTVCGTDEPTCPFFPAGRQIHHPFADPSRLQGSKSEAREAFRRARDEIRQWILQTFGPPPTGGRLAPAPWRQLPVADLLRDMDRVIDAALEEDEACTDPTSRAIFPADFVAHAVLRVKAPGVVAGLPVAARAFQRLDPRIRFTARALDGEPVLPGDVVAEVSGPARTLFAGERTVLNLLQRMSGIATMTRQFADAVATTPAVILDTRKTAPGLRRLDKYAVRIGGGWNHRMSLGGLALVKDNHIDAAGGPIHALSAIRERTPSLPIEIEVRSLAELDLVLSVDPPPNAILCDNFAPAELKHAVSRGGQFTWIEASGGVTLSEVRRIAATGVDAISVGALTHSSPALNLSLDALQAASGKGRPLLDEVRSLRRELGAQVLVLSHAYVREEVSLVADLVGDSLELARASAATEARLVVLCGVRFMGETAAALAAAEQTVLLPSPEAGCSLAECAEDAAVGEALTRLGECGSVVPVAYVNSSLAVKARCGRGGGTTCTSANAAAVLRWALSQGERVLFVPDRNLALHAAHTVGVPASAVLEWNPVSPPSPHEIHDARLVVWPGACSVHRHFTVQDVEAMRRRLPAARVIVHPECDRAVALAADTVGSTSLIARTVTQSPAGAAWAIGTEHRLVLRLAAAHPEKTVVGLSDVPAFCSNMSLIRLESLRDMLQSIADGDHDRFAVRVPHDARADARAAIQRMLDVTAPESLSTHPPNLGIR
ncbi:MAG: quinolinate synthase NadA [Candidatus Bipolaricaulota bacterium]